MTEHYERLGRLVTDATAQIDGKSPWLVVGAVPIQPTPVELVPASGDELRRWLRQHVADWPAPIPIASEQPETYADKLTFIPSRSPGRPATTYYCELHADGSALGALQLGTLRDSPTDDSEVWVLGEGAIAWITIALLRLTAAFAHRTMVLGEAAAEATITPGAGAAMEVWNHAGSTYGPAGDHRLSEAVSTRRTIDLARCLSPHLTMTARPLVLGLLHRFGLSGSRHIDPSGVLQRRHFTGFDEKIRAWADAIGAPSEP
ncbi:hypothetical protein DP939_06190 [Spongiactinospora rosea]|uniref:Uncharacterized protein n=1 Tax=Spongiactinospora rosea TaxID=2248750 RepID=A0A366M398_9ACTN|nr:hypothetical protein [Spongiactinospora rosea]RBQ20671.1 hypothetical protein DP939_06190 [Spongiactinospora rosea]